MLSDRPDEPHSSEPEIRLQVNSGPYPERVLEFQLPSRDDDGDDDDDDDDDDRGFTHIVC